MPTLKHPVTGVVVDAPDDVASFLGWPEVDKEAPEAPETEATEAAEPAEPEPKPEPEKPKPRPKAAEPKG